MHRKHATWLALLLLVVAATFAIGGDEKGKEEKKGKSWYEKIKVSGELRTRFEGRAKFSPAYPADTEHALTLARTRLTIEARPAPNMRAVIQLQDSRVWGEEPSTAANLQNVDLHQGYFVWEKIGGSNFALKLGRQELSYGDERLIGAFGWSNVGRSFDAIKLSYRGKGFFVDGFTATTRETSALEQDSSFSGVYAGFKSFPFGKLEGYALVKLDDREAYAGELDPTAFGTLSVQTFGVRAVGPGGKSPFSYGAELAFQTGDFGDDAHEAWAAHLRAAYKLPASFRLQIRAEYNFASGDDNPTDGSHGTFDNLFPTNHSKYGYIDFIGWRNLKNLRIGATARAGAGHTISFDYHFFWTATSNDDVYRASGAVLLPVPAGVTEDEIGQEIDLTWRFSPSKGLGFLAGYSHFFAGGLFDVASTPGAEIVDADFAYFQATFKF